MSSGASAHQQTIFVYYRAVKQISIQITAETARQMAELAVHWGLPGQRHNTAVVERAVAVVHGLEIGWAEYRRRMSLMEQDGDR